MAHYFALVILPDGLRSSDDKEKIEEWVMRMFTPHFTVAVSGEINEQGFLDSYEIGGRYDGAVNGLPNYYFEALALSESNPDKDYGVLFRRLASEELKRNSCKVNQIKFPPGVQAELPARVIFPDGSVKVMPEWLLSPDFVRTSDGRLREIALPYLPKSKAEVLRNAWDHAWAEIEKEYGDKYAIGVDCHV